MFSEFNLIQRFSFSDPQPVLVDVGAHHGGLSRLFAERGWRVFAFEPENANWSALKRNTAEMENVTCIKKAVSDESGHTVPFYVSSEHFGIHSLKPFHDTHTYKYEVETTTLDDALAQHQATTVTLLKIDIEGADFLALKGFDVRKFRPELIMLEFMDERSKRNFGYTHHDIVAHMKMAGYACLISEWAPIREYAREGEKTDAHQWLGCTTYPLDHEAAWGNLIFVPKGREAQLLDTLKSYLDELQVTIVPGGWRDRLRSAVARIPGARKLYRYLTNH